MIQDVAQTPVQGVTSCALHIGQLAIDVHSILIKDSILLTWQSATSHWIAWQECWANSPFSVNDATGIAGGFVHDVLIGVRHVSVKAETMVACVGGHVLKVQVVHGGGDNSVCCRQRRTTQNTFASWHSREGSAGKAAHWEVRLATGKIGESVAAVAVVPPLWRVEVHFSASVSRGMAQVRHVAAFHRNTSLIAINGGNLIS
jgi:hypothetical protein